MKMFFRTFLVLEYRSVNRMVKVTRENKFFTGYFLRIVLSTPLWGCIIFGENTVLQEGKVQKQLLNKLLDHFLMREKMTSVKSKLK
jgi:hypothetical protein